jgi:hypothetical protein
MKPEIQEKYQGYQRACLEGKQNRDKQTNKERMLREKER